MRLYPLRGSPIAGTTVGVGSYRGSWTTGGVPAFFEMSLSKEDETANGYEQVNMGVGSPGPLNATDSGNTFVFLLPEDMTLSGTLNVCFPMWGDFRYIENLVVHAYLTVQNTGAVRGTFLSNYTEPSGTNNIPDSTTAIAMASPQAITPIDGLAGDYIVIEIGCIFRGPDPNNGNAAMFHGCRSTSGIIAGDLVPGSLVNTTTAGEAAWVEFALVTLPIPDDLSTPCEPGEGGTGTPPNPLPVLQPWSPECIGGGLVPIAAAPGVAELW